MGSGDYTSRLNLDGRVNYTLRAGGPSDSYTQLYRSGMIESVSVLLTRERPDHNFRAVFPRFESDLHDAIPKLVASLAAHGIEGPLFLFLALTGVRGYHLIRPFSDVSEEQFDRDDLHLPELEVNWDFDDSKLKLLLDMIWNAAGCQASPHFDEAGKWQQL